MELERGPLCASCAASRAGQRVVAELAAEQREQEARFAAAASEVRSSRLSYALSG